MASGQVFINDKDLDDLVRLVGNEIMGLTDHISDMEDRRVYAMSGESVYTSEEWENTFGAEYKEAKASVERMKKLLDRLERRLYG
jgi:hypothetical protein